MELCHSTMNVKSYIVWLYTVSSIYPNIFHVAHYSVCVAHDHISRTSKRSIVPKRLLSSQGQHAAPDHNLGTWFIHWLKSYSTRVGFCQITDISLLQLLFNFNGRLFWTLKPLLGEVLLTWGSQLQNPLFHGPGSVKPSVPFGNHSDFSQSSVSQT